MENPISITYLNDFIFCPASIYFHRLFSGMEKMTYQSSYQLSGTAAHEKSDNALYSDRKDVFQAMSIYCEKYNLCGKIDIFYVADGLLVERKKHISTIYDGYIFQLYAQYFSLLEMGYDVTKLKLYSMDDNKSYPVLPPEQAPDMLRRFERTIEKIRTFDLDLFVPENADKCKMCIYNSLCDRALCEVEI